MVKIRAFLQRKDIIFSGKRYGIDALSAMAQGLFCTLLVGTILDTLGKQLGIGFLQAILVTIGKGEGAVSYTIGGTQVSDNMVVTATFKVTPAALAENVINQYNDYVFAEVVTVLTRSAAGPAFIAKAADSTLIIKKGKADGYIDVELTLPKKTEDGQDSIPE